jgi:Post-segregation antitoxin CcdA
MTEPNPHDDQHGRAEREADWLRENADALESSNRYVERYGLPLQRFWLHSPSADTSRQVTAGACRREAQE